MACDLLHCTDSSIYIITSQYLSISVLPHPPHWKFLLPPPLPLTKHLSGSHKLPPNQMIHSPSQISPVSSISHILQKVGISTIAIADIEEFPKYCNKKWIGFEIPTNSRHPPSPHPNCWPILSQTPNPLPPRDLFPSLLVTQLTVGASLFRSSHSRKTFHQLVWMWRLSETSHSHQF